MAYRTAMTIAGDYARANMFPVRRLGSTRKAKNKPTTEIQAALNQKNREQYLHDLILSNFTPDDKFMTLTYRDECYTSDEESAKSDIRNYFRRVKALCIKKSVPQPKYIYVTERGKRFGRLHHHVIVSCDLSMEELIITWNKGNIQYEPLIFNESGVIGYAKYMVKAADPQDKNDQEERIGYRAWSCSKNLNKPQRKSNDYKARAKDVAYMDAHPDDLEYAQKLFPGYIVTRIAPTPSGDDDAQVNYGHFLTVYMYRAETELFGEGLKKKIKRKRKELMHYGKTV